jgi:hypothetical protein
MGRVLCDPIIARLDRFLVTNHFPIRFLTSPDQVAIAEVVSSQLSVNQLSPYFIRFCP